MRSPAKRSRTENKGSRAPESKTCQQTPTLTLENLTRNPHKASSTHVPAHLCQDQHFITQLVAATWSSTLLPQANGCQSCSRRIGSVANSEPVCTNALGCDLSTQLSLNHLPRIRIPMVARAVQVRVSEYTCYERSLCHIGNDFSPSNPIWNNPWILCRPRKKCISATDPV